LLKSVAYFIKEFIFDSIIGEMKDNFLPLGAGENIISFSFFSVKTGYLTTGWITLAPLQRAIKLTEFPVALN
jgi:hypothetical protein